MYFDHYKNRVLLDSNPFKNIIQINSADWQLLSLDVPATPNSSIFQAYPTDDESQRAVIKISHHHSHKGTQRDNQRKKRFEREILALNKIKASIRPSIAVDILTDGKVDISLGQSNKASFQFYVMEKADKDLAAFLAETEISEQQRLLICASLLQSLKQLHSLGIYHRDIKPKNILLFGDQWKLADLGLAAFRDDDVEIDLPNERIGPVGWLSPEAVNKACANRSHPAFNADTCISESSDIFQLGKLFWYIMYGSVPTGQMDECDCNSPELYQSVISPMLQYSKSRRAAIETLESALHPILKAVGI